MPETRTLVRPDGTRLQATPEQAAKLRVLGYKEEGAVEESERISAEARTDDYQTTGDQIQAGVEGTLRGFSFGASDYLVGRQEDIEGRRAANPGIAMGSEIVGAVAPILLSAGAAAPGTAGKIGVASTAALAPTSRLARTATEFGGALGIESKVGRAVVSGATEGAVYGGTAAVDHAYLKGDPLTSEAVLHGMGWGAILGGGIGGAGAGMEGWAAARANKQVADDAASKLKTDAPAELTSRAEGNLLAAREAYEATRKPNFSGTETEIAAKRQALEEAQDAVRLNKPEKPAADLSHHEADVAAKRKEYEEWRDLAANKDSNSPFSHATTEWKNLTGELGGLRGQIKSAKADASTLVSDLQRTIDDAFPEGSVMMQDAGVRGMRDSARLGATAMQADFKTALRYAETGNVAKLEETLARFKEGQAKLDKYMGRVAGDPLAADGASALKDLTTLIAAEKELARLPRSAGEFITMGKSRVEAVSASIDAVKKSGRFPEVVTSLEAQLKGFGEKLGIATDNFATLHTNLVAADKAARMARATTTEGLNGAKTAYEQATSAYSAARGVSKATSGANSAEYKSVIAAQKQAVVEAGRALGRANAAHAAAKSGSAQARRLAKEDMMVAQKAYREALKASKAPPAEVVADNSRGGYLRRIVGWVAGAKAFGLGAAVGGPLGGAMAANAARNAVNGVAVTSTLVAAKNSVSKRLAEAATKYTPTMGRGVQRVAPMVESLGHRLDGTTDDSTKDRQKLATSRIKEMWAAYPTISDRLYKSIEPISAVQPELGPALHATALKSFRTMMEMLPKDPGVVSGLQSIWKSSPLETEKMSRQLAVFHDPVGVCEGMLESGDFDPVSIEALKKLSPSLYQEMRLTTLARISEPEVMEAMSYQDQIGMGTMLSIDIHSGMRPEYIAQSLQLHMKRSEPLPTPGAGGGSGGSGGRPAESSPMSTLGNRVTER